MEKNMLEKEMLSSGVVISPEALLDHWQGHRRLTRKMVEVFPEEKLFTYSIGGMRPFSDLVMEMIGMAVPGLQGVITGNWGHFKTGAEPKTKEAILKLWDETTQQIDELWGQIQPHRFEEKDIAFGKWEGPIYFFIFYWIDNEIHHRGQGYVYLRSIGIEPPAFWDRE